MPRRAYTWGSAEGVQAVINELPERYPMALIANDMEALIRSLAYVADSDACEGEAGNDGDHYRDAGGERHCYDECWRLRAESLLGSFAGQLDVDWI